MSDFETHLRAALETAPAEKKRAKKILQLLDTARPARKARILKRMEQRVRNEFGFSEAEPVDWKAAFELPAWLKTVLDILIKLLPFLLALFGAEQEEPASAADAATTHTPAS